MDASVSPIRIQTPSRLHFGLLVPGPGEVRRYGGLGLGLAEPGYLMEARPSSAWRVRGEEAERAERYLARLLQHQALGQARPLDIHIVRAIPAHVGLGSGTQLACALAWLVARSADFDPSLSDLLRWTGRGARSKVGAAVFASGGFIVDLGRAGDSSQTATYLRFEFPQEWQVALFLPKDARGLHGAQEQAVFAQLGPEANRVSERLCRLALLQIIPALLEGRYEDFAEGLWEYNRLAGKCFEAWQAGSYHSPEVVDLVAFLRQYAPVAVGQSSWGPTVFLIAPEQRLQEVLTQVDVHLNATLGSIIITRASLDGAILCQHQSGEWVPRHVRGARYPQNPTMRGRL
ncbi:MAG: hypothetical protein RMI91_06865 [Gemmatales bacterium]|nr:hypothetical protein [Gemmatales bacterium]MDW7994358.1 hypothetical protein [Gemmatales bacterium]